MKLEEADINKLSPMMKEYVKTKKEYKDILLFYRLGDFYELFFEDALIVSHEDEITLTGKNAGLTEKVPMCGVPYHAVDGHISNLVSKGYKVAICEQMENPKTAKGLVKRDVVKLITPGTNTCTGAVDERDLNYIGCISDQKISYAFSYADLLSGKVYTTYIPYDNNKLLSYLVNLNIKEVVLQDNLNTKLLNELKNNYNIYVSIYNEINKDIDDSIFKNINDIKLKHNTLLLLSYLTNNQRRTLSHFEDVVLINSDKYLYLDKECVKNLELTMTLRSKDRLYSLYWFLDKTKTAMGSRCLKGYLISPLVDKEEITKRHNLVEKLINEFIVHKDLENALYEVYDLERLCGKVSMGNVNARDLLQLKNTLKQFPTINKALSKINLPLLDVFNNIYELLDKTINEDAGFTLKDGNIIKYGYNQELDDLKVISKSSKDFINTFEIEERQRTKIKSLRVGYNRVFGYYIEISKGQVKELKEEFNYTRIQTISTCERYTTPFLKEKENIILGAEEKINTLEYNIFCSIRDLINNEIHGLQKASSYIAYIDVMQSFARVSSDNNLVKPIINDEFILNIKDAFHPVVKKVLKEEYITNDIIMNKDDNILIITGPNMSGKSTYMRQLGVLAIINQIGCFVPASYASIPIFDKIFTRIGASDDLVGGESTFMVEMKESANAIKNATKNSLVLFDELGRGTSTYDGMSLAGAIIMYINTHIKCKTLFSTHYHELTDMENNNGIKNIHVSVYEEDGDVRFLHKIENGAVDKSYGINVAKLAQLPKEVIKNAEELLKIYEKESNIKVNAQVAFDLETQPDELREFIKKIDPLNLTPMEAINILYEIKNKSVL
ncbi:MAG: DNA mismatch repair protein MutS [Bacilli bacterium]